MAHSRNRSSAPIPVYSAPAQCEAPRFTPPPRIPVTISTLLAYQAMLGNNGSGIVHHGPLYDALYFFQRDQAPHGFSDIKVEVAQLCGEEDLNPAITLFWDPVVQTNPREPQINVHPHPYCAAGSRYLPNPNHYSGTQGFANYGYILLNGIWVDPDTQQGTAKALRSPQKLRTPPHFPIISQGPRPMSVAEENAFYRDYIENLVEDLEGDPRNFRISPATFSRWAVGASSGDHYESAIFPVNLVPHSRTISISRPPLTPFDREPQFDVETGSCLSGVYDTQRTPSPIYSAQGLDMSRRPVDFSRMDPQASIDIDRAAYGTSDSRRRTQEWLNSSIASTPSVYNSEAACEELADDGDPQSGVDRYNVVKGHIENLANDLRASRNENQQKCERRREMEQLRFRMERQNFEMKKHLEQTPRRASAYTPPPSETPPGPEVESQLQRSYGQYERYLKEREEIERIGIEKAAESSRVMDAAHEGMMKCLDQLGQVNTFLFEQLPPEARANYIPFEEI